jgi:hypothetical protein
MSNKNNKQLLLTEYFGNTTKISKNIKIYAPNSKHIIKFSIISNYKSLLPIIKENIQNNNNNNNK